MQDAAFASLPARPDSWWQARVSGAECGRTRFIKNLRSGTHLCTENWLVWVLTFHSLILAHLRAENWLVWVLTFDLILAHLRTENWLVWVLTFHSLILAHLRAENWLVWVLTFHYLILAHLHAENWLVWVLTFHSLILDNFGSSARWKLTRLGTHTFHS